MDLDDKQEKKGPFVTAMDKLKEDDAKNGRQTKLPSPNSNGSATSNNNNTRIKSHPLIYYCTLDADVSDRKSLQNDWREARSLCLCREQ